MFRYKNNDDISLSYRAIAYFSEHLAWYGFKKENN